MNKTILSARAVDNFPINQVNGQNGSFATTNGSIAVMRPRGRRDANGNYPTDFFYVEATGKTAEQLGQVNKGDKFFAEGYFYNDSFTDREGAKRTLTKFRIDRVERETADVKKAYAQQNQQPANNQNVGGMAPTSAPQQTMTQPTAPAAPTGAATQQTAPQQTIPNGIFNTPAGMPAGQGMPSAMPDFGALDGMPNFADTPFA